MAADRVTQPQSYGTFSNDAKIIHWEDFEHELARLWSLTSAVNMAKHKKEVLQENLECLIKVQAESLSLSNKLDEMQQKLEARDLLIRKMLARTRDAEQDAKRQEEHISNEIGSVLTAGASLFSATKQLQEDSRSFTGDVGYGRLQCLQQTLRRRQQYMVSQISFLYPVKSNLPPGHELELQSLPNNSQTGTSLGSKSRDQSTLTIAGLHLATLPFTKISIFSDKEAVLRSATALGYVAHVVSMIASCLDVPLRYHIRLGGSRSYIQDHAPFVESNSSDSAAVSSPASDLRPVEFPLFLLGQDTTRAAYAVFLLNKDIEQLLNFVGLKSLGPRHVLPNLFELISTILSAEYLNK